VVRDTIGEEGVELLRKAMGFDRCEEADVIRSAEEIKQCAKRILSDLGIPDDFMEG
jgi:5-methylthioribose kinase